MKTRIISGAVLAVVMIAVLLVGGPLLAAVLLVCSLIGMYELMHALGVVGGEKKLPAVAAAGFVCCALYYLVLFLGGSAYFGEAAALAVTAVMAVYVICFGSTKSEDAISAVFSFIYAAFPLSFIYLIRIEEKGILYVWLVFLSSWVADTAAYFTGYFLGKHKMAPVLSPKKTVEGAVGGVLGAGIAGIIFALLANGGAYVWQCFVICAAGSVISIFGDLAASAIKRDKGVKDYGKLIPGHGGIMDRFDSVIFTAPVIYFLTQLLLRGTIA